MEHMNSRKLGAAACPSPPPPILWIAAAIQSSAQLNDEFRAMEYDNSARMDEFRKIQMQEFAIQPQETIKDQRKLYIQENSEEKKMHTIDWSITSRPNTKSIFGNSKDTYEVIEDERQRFAKS